MRKIRSVIPVLSVLMGILGACANSPEADYVLKNGAVHTMNPKRTVAEAVVVSKGRIVYIGKAKKADKFIGPKTEVLDLAGKMVLPGFCDSHVHLLSGGVKLGLCNLSGILNRDEAFAKISAYAAGHPEMAWIRGSGWELPLFPDANPSKRDLDRLVPDRPAYFAAADGHSAWINSRALAMAGITARTPDPKGGRIERERTGEPSGCLRESAADLVSSLIPKPTQEDLVAALRRAQSLANSFGITSIIDASVDRSDLDVYAGLDRGRGLTVRVLASQSVDPSGEEGQVETLVRQRAHYQGRRLSAGSAKIFIDGVLESHTGALLEPYVDRPGDGGQPLCTAEELNRMCVALDKAGFQIHVHAIGDKAVRMALDAFEFTRTMNGRSGLRHHIAHLELIHPQDVSRFKALDVAANFQALWAYPDPYITQLTIPIIGPERTLRLYPIGSVARTSAHLVGGSDWAVSSLNPLDAIHVAVTRRALDSPTGPALNPAEKVDLDTMLAAYTINGAYLGHREGLSGSIVRGKSADLIVLDRDITKVPSAEIHQAQVELTLLEGEVVFKK